MADPPRRGNHLRDGDLLENFDYRTVLSRALDRTRYLVIKDRHGDKSTQHVPLSDLDPETRKAYDRAQRIIDKLQINIPVSPIDWIRHRIEEAGYSVAEITGRNLAVDYSDPENPKLSHVPIQEQRDKVETTRRFNDGRLDSLVLNAAGSTGISLHASEKFADQRPRHMFVLQPAQDINTFMQMLGRIHRTGQVRLPSYTILNVDLPAEKRPTALLSKKMKSLNANTSSNTESATSVKAVDMLNKYGDQIIGHYLSDNLLAAFGELKETRGTIINFNKQDGTIEQGILLPKKFDFKQNTKGDYRLRDAAHAVKFLKSSVNPRIEDMGIYSRDHNVRVVNEAGKLAVITPKAKARGGKYFLDHGITNLTGDFVSQGNTMRAVIPANKEKEG